MNMQNLKENHTISFARISIFDYEISKSSSVGFYSLRKRESNAKLEDGWDSRSVCLRILNEEKDNIFIRRDAKSRFIRESFWGQWKSTNNELAAMERPFWTRTINQQDELFQFILSICKLNFIVLSSPELINSRTHKKKVVAPNGTAAHLGFLSSRAFEKNLNLLNYATSFHGKNQRGFLLWDSAFANDPFLFSNFSGTWNKVFNWKT